MRDRDKRPEWKRSKLATPMASGTHDLDAHLQLRCDDPALTATLRIGPAIPIESVVVGTLLLYLESRGISAHAVDHAAVASLVDEALNGPGAEHAAVVACGRKPRNGIRQKLEWSSRITAEIEAINRRREALAAETQPGTAGVPKSADQINFYEQSAFVIVQKDDVIGTVTPPDPGEDGEDVYGKAIPAKGSPSPSDLNTETIGLSPDHRVIALTSGRLIYSGPERAIHRTLSITSDIGFVTGNIDFPGPVCIDGGVRDRFIVRAVGTVTIRGLVEASTIESRRDIMLERGAAGRETGTLRAAQTLRSGYLDATRVWCGQDCLVQHEITNCQVFSRGMVKIPTGAIRGGTVSAARGIETAIVGSAQEVRTELLVGTLDELEQLLRQTRARGDEARTILDEMLARQSMLKSVRGSGKMTPEQIEAQMAMDFDITETERWISGLDAATQRLEKNLRGAICPVLKALQCIYSGVVLWMPGYRATFRNEVKGESLIRLDRFNKPVIEHRGETHPLSKFASVEQNPRIYLLPIPETHPPTEAAA